MNIFFGFVGENTGYAIVTRGDQLIDIRVVGDQNLKKEPVDSPREWEVYTGGRKFDRGILGLLQKKFGWHWMGWWPFQFRYTYEMYRTVFERDPKAPENQVIRKRDTSDFFYTQRVEYAFELLGPETGSASDEEGGNISVNLNFAVFLQVVRPYVALFDNPVWFERASSILLGHARVYVGSRAYEALRGEVQRGDSDVSVFFSRYMSNLNEIVEGDDNTGIPGEEYGFVETLGVKVVGAAIRTVDITKESAYIREATTLRYAKTQEAAGIRTVAEAQADAIRMDIDATCSHPIGPHVRHQRAMEEAGRNGNTVVFDSSGDSSDKLLAYGKDLIKQKDGETNKSEPSSEEGGEENK